MEWKNLLCSEKLIEEESIDPRFDRYPVNEFNKDFRKIVSSAPFRRLQDKTQVFPLDKSDFVRTRLTHSMEVSSIAKQMGIMLCNDTNEEHKLSDITDFERENIPAVLACAGLLHDLGNPPFGHFGEMIISQWFSENLSKLNYFDKKLDEVLTEQMMNDFKNFEGNAQALRVLCKAQHDSEINLSYAVLGSLVKYPTNSLNFDKKSEDIKMHKFGVYLSEEETFVKVSEKLGTKLENGEIARHPLAFLVEAADDISYLTADLEDAFKKDIFTVSQFIELVKEISSEDTNKSKTQSLIESLENLNEKYKNREDKCISEWIEIVRSWFMYCVIFSFTKTDRYEAIMSGTYKEELFHDTFHENTVKVFKKIMQKYVFDSKSLLKIEIASKNILDFLLNNFVGAVLYYDLNDNDFKPTNIDKKYIAMIPQNLKDDYALQKTEDEVMNLYRRILMVTDFVSGMTDSFAQTLYRELSGIS